MLTCAELFKNHLDSKNLNYRCNVDGDGDVVIDFPYQGKVTKCIFSGDEGKYLSLYLVYERIPDEKVADLIFLANELNAKFKWVTFFVDKDKDIVLHDDAILSVETAASEAFELMIRMIKIGDDVKPMIMKAIYA